MQHRGAKHRLKQRRAKQDEQKRNEALVEFGKKACDNNHTEPDH